ncbi:MAG: RNA 2',3'-cyclic phosphodiesterase [Candidatus Sericytochromatia bacterium]|nr:RNA 2',3'-cyclic phosphodiesterase [Candidatus Sericytochromatia bacterium]
MTQTQRLFIACPLPAALTEACVALQDQCMALVKRPRPLQPGDLHLTLRFLGPTPAALLPDLGAALQALAGQSGPFDLQSAALGGFPQPQAAHVLVWHMQLSHALQALYDRLQHSLQSLGTAPEARPYKPHVTLLRCPRQALPALPAAPLHFWRADRLSFYRSELSPAGSRYTRLSDAMLGETEAPAAQGGPHD